MNNLKVINGSEAQEPQSIEAEQMLLGALMLFPDRIAETAGRGGPTLFFDPFHAHTFKVMSDADRRGNHVSPVTMTHMPSLQDGLSELGQGYFARLAGSSSRLQIDNCLEILEEKRARRDLFSAVQAVRSDIFNEDVPAVELAARLEAAILAMNVTEKAARPISMMAAATKALSDIHDAYHGETPKVVASGISALDNMIFGFGPGEMSLLGGRPSMGKTGVALSIALNAARAGHGVIFASLEMTPDSLAIRAMAEGTGHKGGAVSYAAARRGEMTEQQFINLREATKVVAELPIQFLPRRYADPSALFSGVKQALRVLPQDKLPIVIVDYLQLMQVRGTNRFEQITAISQALKDTAMRLEVPVMALSQLSRAVEQRDDKRPVLSDLRESGQLEQDADQIMFCYRDEYYLSKEEPDTSDMDAYEAWRNAMERARNRLEIIVSKQRQGSTGTVRVRFNPALNLLWED